MTHRPTIELWQGAATPEAFNVTCPANATVTDLSGTTAAEIRAKWLPSGAWVTWAATVVSATADEVVIRRVLDGTETTRVGTWACVVVLTVDGEPRLQDTPLHVTIKEIR